MSLHKTATQAPVATSVIASAKHSVVSAWNGTVENYQIRDLELSMERAEQTAKRQAVYDALLAKKAAMANKP